MKSAPKRAWILGIETLFNLNNTDWTSTGLYQARFFAGMGFPLSVKVRLETGYQMQWIKRQTRENIVNHTWIASFRF